MAGSLETAASSSYPLRATLHLQAVVKIDAAAAAAAWDQVE